MKIEFAPQKFVELEFHSIDVAGCALTIPYTPATRKGFDYLIEIDNSVVQALDHVVVTVKVTIKDHEDQQLGYYKAHCMINVHGFSVLDWNNPANAAMRLQLATIWNSIAISTVRGMMFTEFKGTLLHKAILPIVNPAQYVPSED
jgi:hypothetical protein